MSNRIDNVISTISQRHTPDPHVLGYSGDVHHVMSITVISLGHTVGSFMLPAVTITKVSSYLVGHALCPIRFSAPQMGLYPLLCSAVHWLSSITTLFFASLAS